MSSPWVAAARPKTLFASACPVVLGAVAAAQEAPIPWHWLLATLACALLLQITANYANDYWDFRKGADTPRRKGPPRMTASGRVAPRAMLAATCISLLLALLMGAVLTWRGGWPILLIGLAAAASAILYTSGPFPLAYRGLGEVFALVFFGPVSSAGTAWVLALAWMPEAALLGLAPGGFSTALMSLNNLRDREEDARAGKRTLAVRFGERVGRGMIVLSIWLPVAACALLLATRLAAPAAPGGIVAVILASRLTRQLKDAAKAADFNPLIPAIARASTVFTTAFAISSWLL